MTNACISIHYVNSRSYRGERMVGWVKWRYKVHIMVKKIKTSPWQPVQQHFPFKPGPKSYTDSVTKATTGVPPNGHWANNRSRSLQDPLILVTLYTYFHDVSLFAYTPPLIAILIWAMYLPSTTTRVGYPRFERAEKKSTLKFKWK